MFDQIGTVGRIAIIVVLLLLIIWIAHTAYKTGYMPDGVFRDTYESMMFSAGKQYDKYFESPLNMYTKTTGYDDDDAAQIATSKALKLEDTHILNEQSGTMTTTANDAITNAFVLGELYRFNVAPNLEGRERQTALDTAQHYYLRALRRIQHHTQQATGGGPAPEAVLDRVDVMGNPQIHRQVQTTRDAVRQARQVKARKQTDARAAYFEEREIRNDPQNVHDSVATHDIKVKFDTIKKLNDDDAANADPEASHKPTLADVRASLLNSDLDDKKKRYALEILDNMKAANLVSSVNTTEDQVVLEVWKRIHSADNTKQRASLKASLFDALASAMEKRYDNQATKVCSTGRISRVLDCLTLLDTSEKVAAPVKTLEILRNEIFMKSHTILQSELQKQSKDVIDAYNGVTEPSAEVAPQLETFKESTKHVIEETLRSDYRDTKPDQLDNLIKDAQAGVDI